DPTSTGVSELPGGSFIVAFGYSVDLGFSVGIETQAGTFMHELGHNFGLKHGSLAAPAPQSCDVLKPNYVSVMGYSYQSGIEVAAEPGSSVPMRCQVDGDCPAGTHCTDDFGPGDGGNVCYRSDYSREKLLDLDEAMLNEPLGVAGPAGDTDIIVYCAHGVGCSLMGPGNGPIDWNNDGNATEPDVQGDIDNNGSPNNLLETGNDWELTAGALENLNFKFQCTTAFKADSGESSHASVPSSFATVERSLKDAREKHTLHPDFAAEIAISPSCSQARKPIAPGQPGTL